MLAQFEASAWVTRSQITQPMQKHSSSRSGSLQVEYTCMVLVELERHISRGGSWCGIALAGAPGTVDHVVSFVESSLERDEVVRVGMLSEGRF